MVMEILLTIETFLGVGETCEQFGDLIFINNLIYLLSTRAYSS